MQSNEEVWQDIKNSVLSIPLDTSFEQGRLLYGCKVTKCNSSGRIDFYNAARGGEWYIKLNESEIDVFRRHGFRQGVYSLMMSNVILKLDSIQRSIRNEVNGKNNTRRIQTLKNHRQRLIKNFNLQTKKFKQRNYVTEEISLDSIIKD